MILAIHIPVPKNVRQQLGCEEAARFGETACETGRCIELLVLRLLSIVCS